MSSRYSCTSCEMVGFEKGSASFLSSPPETSFTFIKNEKRESVEGVEVLGW